MKKVIISMVIGVIVASGALVAAVVSDHVEAKRWERICDGVEIQSSCSDKDGKKYDKYVYHEAQKEIKERIEHPAEPEISHTVYHQPVYGKRRVAYDCVRTSISYKHGTCAQSQCWDGEYSGSSGWGTCSYHGGVMRHGPWYLYREESYIIKAGWYEKIIDIPAKQAWVEEKVLIPAKDAYYEKILAKR